jgi:hypothetical protein
MSKAQTQTTNAVATKQSSSVATLDVTQLENLAGLGVENVGQRDLALPFLKILSQLSPQVTAGDSRFIEEAKPGQIYNSVSDQLYDGKKGIRVVPCFYKLEYLEWRDRGQEGSGAPIAIYDSTSDILSKTTRGPDKKDRLPNGNYIEETASHYVVLVDDNDQATETALITMKATQRKKSRKWNSMIMTQRVKGKNGFFQPPSFAQIYRLKTTLEKNNLGSWYGWDVEFNSNVNNPTLLKSAQDFYNTCKQGEVKVQHGEEEPTQSATTQNNPY